MLKELVIDEGGGVLGRHCVLCFVKTYGEHSDDTVANKSRLCDTAFVDWQGSYTSTDMLGWNSVQIVWSAGGNK